MPPGLSRTWSMDFVFDALVDDRPIQCLTVVDDCAQECVVIGAWRRDYNEVRPHRSIADQTPAEFAVTLRETGRLATEQTTSDKLTNQDSTK